ncbi:hypothetical protein [Falsirhodobacter sp. 20TX0035]|uniref:hypothetical protein n=1 Tax=Falsirhodobacter sp. 20TX0035 TaxID=3022019 RepID=UPI00232C3E7E|nr:hypothetical protein [Falsirhodobacter sp. 20TX0035]MDB6454748.1 hypothetical protein [Falsirhodobacter sp. 20TX0035]
MNSIAVEFETMSGVFHKMHLRDLPSRAILHWFTGADEGNAHDHPFDIDILILMGGYVERVWQPDGTYEDITRSIGDKFITSADKIHKIIELLDGPCLTIATYGPGVKAAGFWRWIDGKAQRRDWNGEWEDRL